MIDGTKLRNVQAGDNLLIRVEAKDSWGNIVNRTLSTRKYPPFIANFTKPKVQLLNLSYTGDGMYSSNTSFNVSGRYDLSITYARNDISGSPLSFYISPSKPSDSCMY